MDKKTENLIDKKIETMEDIFKEVNKMKPIKLTPQDAVRMKKEVYAQKDLNNKELNIIKKR